jgi:hypothetical protein
MMIDDEMENTENEEILRAIYSPHTTVADNTIIHYRRETSKKTTSNFQDNLENNLENIGNISGQVTEESNGEKLEVKLEEKTEEKSEEKLEQREKVQPPQISKRVQTSMIRVHDRLFNQCTQYLNWTYSGEIACLQPVWKENDNMKTADGENFPTKGANEDSIRKNKNYDNDMKESSYSYKIKEEKSDRNSKESKEDSIHIDPNVTSGVQHLPPGANTHNKTFTSLPRHSELSIADSKNRKFKNGEDKDGSKRDEKGSDATRMVSNKTFDDGKEYKGENNRDRKYDDRHSN